MWQRDESKPVTYTGVPFRSGLEAAVAKNFDAMGVEWAYERGVEGIAYLPDFTILDSIVDFQLPQWVEVKPAQLLYAVRDHLGVPERFTNDVFSDPLTAEQLRDAGLSEIWKPKALAELEHQPVLVVSKINCNRTLSILMQPEQIVLSRSHRCVNWKQVKIDEENRRRREQWQREAAQRQAERAEQDEARRANNLAWARAADHRPARYDGRCIVCGASRPAGLLRIARYEDRWLAFCHQHLGEAG
jgi:hypothetical protein